MRKVIIGIFILASLVECKKEENKSVAKIDFRDKIVGHYITSTFSHSHYPTPPTYFDSTIYYNDTIEILIEKLNSDTCSIVLMDDTLKLYFKSESSALFSNETSVFEPFSKWAHSVSFSGDSLILTYGEGGSRLSYSSHGWRGKKK